MRHTQWTGAARHAWCRAVSAAAFVSLVAALLMCLGATASHEARPNAGAPAGAGTGSVYSDSDEAFAACTAPLDDSDCPPADRCCASLTHGVRAAPKPAGASPVAGAPYVPRPRAQSATGPASEPPSDRGSTDLHMLQVQRI